MFLIHFSLCLALESMATLWPTLPPPWGNISTILGSAAASALPDSRSSCSWWFSASNFRNTSLQFCAHFLRFDEGLLWQCTDLLPALSRELRRTARRSPHLALPFLTTCRFLELHEYSGVVLMRIIRRSPQRSGSARSLCHHTLVQGPLSVIQSIPTFEEFNGHVLKGQPFLRKSHSRLQFFLFHRLRESLEIYLESLKDVVYCSQHTPSCAQLYIHGWPHHVE